MPIVSTRDVRRTYEDGTQSVRALDGVDLDVGAGEFLALMGPSGSGKTTLLNVIGGLDTPDSGTVLVDGQDLSTLDKEALSELRLKRIGFVFQAYNLIPVLSAEENAEFVLMIRGVPEAERRERVAKVLGEVGLGEYAHRRPNELSGGQQQRVAVARAIVGEPALVLADEPTANLDSKSAQELIELMESLNQTHGTTFIFATHDPRVLAAARRVVRLVDGRIDSDERR